MMRQLIVLCLFCFSAAEMAEVALNSGYKLPFIGLGTYSVQTEEIVDNALASGYRLFDSAKLYDNERQLGEAFEKLLPKYNLQRSDLFITTKIYLSTKEKTEADIEKLVRESLTNFRTDYIDLYLIHWPGVTGLQNDDPEVLTYRRSAWNALVKFQKQGLIRSIGVSNFMVKHLEDLKKHSDVVPALNQVQWHPKSHKEDLLDYCKSNGIVLQAYSSLGSSNNATLRNDETVLEIAKKLGKSTSQVLLRWATQRDIPIIPKASKMKHLDENMDLDFTIPEDDMKTLNNFAQSDRGNWNPDNVI